jgi:hypothetical protein
VFFRVPNSWDEEILHAENELLHGYFNDSLAFLQPNHYSADNHIVQLLFMPYSEIIDLHVN